YINNLTKRALPPTRAIIKTFAFYVALELVSELGVTHFCYEQRSGRIDCSGEDNQPARSGAVQPCHVTTIASWQTISPWQTILRWQAIKRWHAGI
ncbi:hypothetical protein CC86DRAFT_299487, partial [Ophiobolus disseminans]